LKIILLSILLTGCSIPDYEYKITCDSFKTEWVEVAYVTEGILYYNDNEGRGVAYKIKFGESCAKEKRRVYE